jgi:hypothetical protein
MKTADLDQFIRSRGAVPDAATRMEERISLAANLALENGYIDGAAHKQFVLSQMLRILLTEEEEAQLLDDNWDDGIAP